MTITSSMLWYLCPHLQIPRVIVPPGVDHLARLPGEENRSVVTPQDKESLSR
ncbi:expressed unknown protein [Ectocarpus siliculosus]|uniref:Uncharacterized protein n=1 Tax=Ectocarpus siliculosus TaxID=2880 RepID=D8LL25_ECTSI|nr:expressed unknown protein [Ectocarpus siliculosus]|eukprot:CBN76119.1 expressed unknown protein [Ectocarpus siliculosus]